MAVATAVLAVAGGARMRDAHAVDLPKIDGTPVKLDITETSIVAQRFAARDGENPDDQGTFAWLNRLNLVLGWRRFTVGARIDASAYMLRPEDRTYADPQLARNAIIDGSTRYRDAIYPAKLWASYKVPFDSGSLELTAGDSYVQFGRGLVLSLRKVDELGIDTTLFGGKLSLQSDPFAFTVIAGIANPARVDEPTGRALFLPKPVPGDRLGPQPIFGSDRLVGAQIQAGRGLPVIASTHAVRLTKCAPYHYRADGTVEDAPLDAPLGTCEDADTATWLATLPQLGPVLRASSTINAGQSLEVPDLGGHGSIYVEAAVQHREGERPTDGNTDGNALYASVVTSGGPVTNTLEVKSYRNFFPLTGSVNVSKASAFGNIAYSAPPTAEAITQDSMFGFFNACVDGGRDRLDYRLTPELLVYGTFGYFVTKSEMPGGQCDRFGRSTSDKPNETTNQVFDASAGAEWRFDDDKSIAFFNFGGRHDARDTGDPYYRELAGQYSVTKYIAGPVSIELSGRHRYRMQDRENVHDGSFQGQPWWQGEHQNAVKIAPKWVLSQGFEYTTFVGLPTYYVNGGVLYKFTSESNIRLYGGQNRGGLRCVSGICRVFPAFSGVRAELTLRF